MKKEKITYKLKNKVRIVTAASLFDGHDASINIMRRIMQSYGCEVIHLGHNRSAGEIVECAIQEDVQSIAITSYQGGHIEFLKYMYDLLNEKGCGHIKIFAGGGGVILPDEIKELEDYGIEKIYSPDDGRKLGLTGMIEDLLIKSDFPVGKDIKINIEDIKSGNFRSVARLISAAENYPEISKDILSDVKKAANGKNIPVIGITGTGGAGKSSMIDEFINRFLADFENKKVGIISVDPSKRKTGGALLGDRIRMNAIHSDRVYMRSLATRRANVAVSDHIKEGLDILKAASFDLIILETSGIGQSDSEVTEFASLSLYIMTPEYGAGTQLEKIDMLDFADIVVINKFDKRGAQDALRDVRKQYRRNHSYWEGDEEDLPVYGTTASKFNDKGMNILYSAIIEKTGLNGNRKKEREFKKESAPVRSYIIPPNRNRYLSEISDAIKNYDKWAEEQSEIADTLYAIDKTRKSVEEAGGGKEGINRELASLYNKEKSSLSGENLELLKNWGEKTKNYENDLFSYKVRNRELKVETKSETLSHLKIPKISIPKYKGWGDILSWSLQENFPGEFPYTAGVFPFKREGEDPTRMFAGEGGPERTNRRFHYLSSGLPANRLSTAFDSVTLYGADPEKRPDIYGKIGNSGVSISCLDDMKKLYSGFHLTDPKTSVSMTINGPAAIMVGYFLNTAIDQECEIHIKAEGLEKEIEEKIVEIYREKGVKRPVYHGKLPDGNDGLGLKLIGVTGDQVLPGEVYEKIKKDTISKVRGTVQADILKEDQAQNTCIFSTEFSLKLMGDVQEYFTNNNVRNFYSVSISGYHIAEAGANPVTQLALTLSNGFTFVEYYISRGMDINDFAPSLSFFFSNGIDPEYAVIGRVARRIWAKAIKYKYKGDERSQKLKYHIQTSGRSLHSQEIDFNDIRTTLQAIYAIYDNCNSLHTNAYDEAITTPTEESVRRAMAIQMIINHEFGITKNQNPNQGSFIIEELTDLVEEAVLEEFERISERGGVLGAMERNYQRSRIQEESLYYEKMKNSGEYPIMGVNTFLSSTGSPTIIPGEVIRATEEEKENQIKTIENLIKGNKKQGEVLLKELKDTAIKDKNLFETLMEVTKYCSIGQITDTLYSVGGMYRRNM
ncbi:MAG: methylmalonyl-CoA mutase family protein [Acidobacteriota bacterium]